MITTKDIDKKLRTLFPKVFTYLDEQHPNDGGQIHWALAAKSGATTMTLSGISNPCGEDITDTRHPKGKKWNTQSMYFGMFSAESVVIGYQPKLTPYLCSDTHGNS
jgi:hypothetical protein